MTHPVTKTSRTEVLPQSEIWKPGLLFERMSSVVIKVERILILFLQVKVG